MVSTAPLFVNTSAIFGEISQSHNLTSHKLKLDSSNKKCGEVLFSLKWDKENLDMLLIYSSAVSV